MAFGFAGAAAGSAKSLEDIVAERILAQKLEAEIADRQQRTDLERAALNQRTVEADTAAKQRQQQIDMQAGDRRERTNQQGVRRMLGEAITQRTGPMTSDDRRGLAALQVEAGDAPTLLNEPKPERDPIADHRAKRAIDAEYDTPTAAPRPQVFQVNGRLVDANGRVVYDGGSPNGANPEKAQETRQSMLETARALRKHPGLGNLTGARIGNPDYALGVSQEPIGGSQAADAKPFYDRLKALFTVENIGLLKGVLSDSDMKILASVGTSLDTKMTDPTFVAELDNIIQKLEGAAGSAPGSTPGAPPPATGRRMRFDKTGKLIP